VPQCIGRWERERRAFLWSIRSNDPADYRAQSPPEIALCRSAGRHVTQIVEGQTN
jgi:hypothetical protein